SSGFRSKCSVMNCPVGIGAMTRLNPNGEWVGMSGSALSYRLAAQRKCAGHVNRRARHLWSAPERTGSTPPDTVRWLVDLPDGETAPTASYDSQIGVPKLVRAKRCFGGSCARYDVRVREHGGFMRSVFASELSCHGLFLVFCGERRPLA